MGAHARKHPPHPGGCLRHGRARPRAPRRNVFRSAGTTACPVLVGIQQESLAVRTRRGVAPRAELDEAELAAGQRLRGGRRSEAGPRRDVPQTGRQGGRGKTARRKRAAFNEALNTAVEKGYFAENPLNGLRWKAPAVNEEVDPAAVPNPAGCFACSIPWLASGGRGPHLEAFFGCMYFAAMWPAEVIHLRIDQCHLPKNGRGMLKLSGGVVTSGKEWTDVGEVHSLKRRAANATRPIPIPPQFVRMLRAHVKRVDVAPDGRLFRNQAGNYVDAAAYGITWARAREYALTRTERTSRLAKRPYDLRRVGMSFWLYSGVDPAECARRAGQSIEVLFRHYAKFLDGLREQANRLIEHSMNEWQRVSQVDAPGG